ncbi:hypothetical protein GQ43DRAFT_370216, partial [Delitschia confertaspora ATCC 74209]
VILQKPDKFDYSILKAYWITSPVNCLAKVREKILASRLGYLANISGFDLLGWSHIGCRE